MFGERLQSVRKYYAEKQEELAAAVNSTVFAVRSWEQNRHLPSCETLTKICKHYQTSADYLLGLTDINPLDLQSNDHELNRENQYALRRFEAFLLSEQKRAKK